MEEGGKHRAHPPAELPTAQSADGMRTKVRAGQAREGEPGHGARSWAKTPLLSPKSDVGQSEVN